MKKLLILLILLSSCTSKNESSEIKTLVITNNVTGIITAIDEDKITIAKNNELLEFPLDNIDVSEYNFNDEVSVVYNQTNDEIKVISVILQKKAVQETTENEITGVIVKGTTYNDIIIQDEKGQVVNLINIDVEIKFEGELVPGMKVHARYDNDNYLLSLDILE